MTCEYCDHCKANARNAQDRANLYPLGTHLVHAKLGHVVYWRNDLQSDNSAGGGHYVYRAGDSNRDLLYVWGNEFELATVEIDVPAALARFLTADPQSAQILAELGPGRTYRGGLRLTLTYEQTWELSRIAYWARDCGDAPVAAARGATRLTQKLKALGR